MRKLNHPNITKILEMFEDEKYILIIMEYINGGNLFSFVKKRRKLNEKISKFLFKQIILGIKHIHSQNIVHRDVKLENILIDLNNTIKICDFGIGRILSSPDELLHDQCGTPMYMAPEILSCSKEKGYKGFPVDIWSAGIALYIMLSGTLPFSIKDDIDSFVDENDFKKKKNLALRQAIIYNEPKKIEKISDKARDLLHGLLNKDPNKRLTCDEILNHPWLNSDDINNQHHLFTKAEMIMLSKTYIDYRKANMDELQENFTISNLKRDKIKNTDKNATTKSFILTPYNSLICDEDSNEEEIEKYNDSEFDDKNNENINLENEIISFNNKVKEYNMLYELNNNNEVDNGMLINTKINSSVATFSITNGIMNNNSVVKTESVFCVEEDGNKDNCDEDGGCHKKVLIKNKQIKNQDKDTLKEKEKNKNKIFDKIEVLGYDKKYVQKCLENNILCHATSIYFLLMNYDNI
jgi:serine/threonine protein kinase